MAGDKLERPGSELNLGPHGHVDLNVFKKSWVKLTLMLNCVDHDKSDAGASSALTCV